MFGLTVSEAAAICGGSVYTTQEMPESGDVELTGIAIDSRAVEPGNLFVAYRGRRTGICTSPLRCVTEQPVPWRSMYRRELPALS